MQVLRWTEPISGILFDVDGTLYPRSEEYELHQREIEMIALTSKLSIESAELKQRISTASTSLQSALKRTPSSSEIIYAMGLDQAWLTDVRKQWRPDLFLSVHEELPGLIIRLIEKYNNFALVSTSPHEIVELILKAIGMSEIIGKVIILGSNDVVATKPDPEIYVLAANLLRLDPRFCLSIGDRIDLDCMPAVGIGMSAIWVETFEDTINVAKDLLDNSFNTRSDQEATECTR